MPHNRPRMHKVLIALSNPPEVLHDRKGQYKLGGVVMGEESVADKKSYTMKYSASDAHVNQSASLYLHFPLEEKTSTSWLFNTLKQFHVVRLSLSRCVRTFLKS